MQNSVSYSFSTRPILATALPKIKSLVLPFWCATVSYVNPKMAARAICEALRGDDFGIVELEWVEFVIRSLFPTGDDKTPIPGRLGKETIREFPGPNPPAPLSAVLEQGLLSEWHQK